MKLSLNREYAVRHLGVAALMARSVVSSELVAYGELGTEAVRKLVVDKMPLTVAIDTFGANIYEKGPARYLESLAVDGDVQLGLL